MSLDDALVARMREVVEEALAEREPRAEYVTAAKVTEATGLTQRTLKTLREKGLPCRKVGRVLFYKLADLDRFVEERGVVRR